MSQSPDNDGFPSNNTRSRANGSARQQHREFLDASADPRRLRRSAVGPPLILFDRAAADI
jgi:hypothetical protein